MSMGNRMQYTPTPLLLLLSSPTFTPTSQVPAIQRHSSRSLLIYGVSEEVRLKISHEKE